MAFVAESFLPRVNGVTNSVCRAVEHLVATGHEALVIAPSPAPVSYAGARVVSVPAITVPGMPGDARRDGDGTPGGAHP